MQVAPSGWTAPEIEYGYALCLGLAFVVGWRIRTMERRRLDWARDPRMRSVGIWALVGAAIGAKLGLLLFVPLDDFGQALTNIFRIDFTGKTVVGGLAGGYVAVELAKRRLGLTESTGDIYAVALPAGQAIGRWGCVLHGCCYGSPTSLPWAQSVQAAARHPAPIYESLACLILAAILWSQRTQVTLRGVLFRRYVVGYAMIRFGVEFYRGDPGTNLWGLSLVQWICLVSVACFWRPARLPWPGQGRASRDPRSQVKGASGSTHQFETPGQDTLKGP